MEIMIYRLGLNCKEGYKAIKKNDSDKLIDR